MHKLWQYWTLITSGTALQSVKHLHKEVGRTPVVCFVGLSLLKKVFQDTKAACFVVQKNATALNNPGKYLNGAYLYAFILDSYREVF